ncbi:MAG: carbamoyl transferase, partial [Proteobacteria bacterium]
LKQSLLKDILNQRVKFREGFRPFAPLVLEENCGEYFEHDYPSPYMLKVYQVRKEKRSIIPAVTHVDGSGRVQTVKETENPPMWNLINEFKKISGVPILINTSFNIKGEPIVCTPKDAVDSFIRADIDYLVMGRLVVGKDGSPVNKYLD